MYIGKGSREDVFLMGLLAVIVIYLMERENGKKEAVKSVKMVLLVILFLL